MDQSAKKNIAYVSPNDDLKTLITVFHNLKISHLPVVNQEKLVGLVSKTDLADYLYNNFNDKAFMSLQDFFTETKVKQLMTQPLIEAQINDTTMTILEKLITHDIGSVVLKDGQRLAGIVTEKDMIKYFTKNQEENTSFTEKVSHHIVQWLDKNGLIKISTMLADIGI